jgi:hypothetical protein
MKIPDLGKGVNKDLLPSELSDGWWSDCLNFRFRNGFAEKFEGVISKDTGATISATSGAFLFPFSTSMAVYGNTTKAYCLDAATPAVHTEITRYRKSETISTLNRLGANSAEVTTASNHGLSTGDVVTVFGATEDGYNDTSRSITVTAVNKFTYVTVDAIASNATVVGQYVVVTSVAFSDFAGLPTYPTGGALNGVFFLYGTDGLYYWGGSAAIRLRQVPFSIPSGVTAVRSFKNYLFLLGGQVASWTDATEPGAIPTTTTSTDTNDAGSAPALAETPGSLVDCLPLGDVNILYKSDSYYATQYIGGIDVFAFTRIPGNDGLYRPWCVVETPKGHVFLTQNLDIKIHQGGAASSIAEGVIRKYFASTFDVTSHSERVFLAVNPEKSEVWVLYATSASTRGCDRALVWNWDANEGAGAWGILDLTAVTTADGVSFAASGSWPASLTSRSRLMLMNTAFDMLMVDSAATTSITGTLERTGMDFGDRDTFKSIQRSRWNVDGTAGNTLSVYHGSSKTADGAVTWTSPATYTIGTTDYANARATSGRFGAVKLSTTTTAAQLLRSCDLDVTGGGKR